LGTELAYSVLGASEPLTYVWQIGSTETPSEYTGQNPKFSRDGQMLYLRRDNGDLDVVDLARGIQLTEISAEDDNHPVGRFVEGDGNSAHTIDYQSAERYPIAVYLHEFNGESRLIYNNRDNVNLMSFSPDGNLLIVLDGDKLEFFDGHNGAWVYEMYHVVSASFSSDGTQLYIISDDQTMQVYGVAS
jgi:WD40 repeat protein